MALLIVFSIILSYCFGVRRALVIGNSDYGKNSLRNAVNDARDLAKALKEIDFEVTLVTDADLRKFETSVSGFTASIRPVDEVLFFYSGHGVQYNGENFLLPARSEIVSEVDLKYDAISANRISEHLQKGMVSIMILDACRDNPFRGIRSSEKGLAVMQAASGTQYIMYSTASGKTSSDGDGRNSPFTSALLKYILRPGMEITDVFRNVSKEVREQTHNRQTPFIYGSLDEYFYFAKAKPMEEKRPPVIPLEPEKQPMQIIKEEPVKPMTENKPVLIPEPSKPLTRLSILAKGVKPQSLVLRETAKGKINIKDPAKIELSEGSYTLSFEQWGYHNYTSNFGLNAGEQKDISFTPTPVNARLMNRYNSWNLQKQLSIGTSLITLGAAVLFKLMGDSDYKKYQDATDRDAIVKYRDSSQTYQTLFYTSLSTHLISDAWWFYTRGKRNSLHSEIRSEMQQPAPAGK